LEYQEQLKAKQIKVQDALNRIGKIDVTVDPCVPSLEPFAYRNKLQLCVDPEGRLCQYAKDSHQLVPIKACAIHCPLGEKTLQAIREALHLLGPFHSLKQIVVKTATQSKEVLIVLMTSDAEPLSKLATHLMQKMDEIQGVVQFHETAHLLAGKDGIRETLCGLEFTLSSASFFQVNPKQAEHLYETVRAWAQIQSTDRVLDAYCGIGTLSLILAPDAQEVIGIESVEQAILNANANATLNQIHNVQFICGRAEEKIDSIDRIDVAIINPPRGGCERSFLEALALKRPQKILYVSCDPATLARDLSFLTAQGYQVKRVRPFDMFPQTMHVETIAYLDWNRSD
jgi:23S rRNA (uracil1939-C5)-methyltransferase